MNKKVNEAQILFPLHITSAEINNLKLYHERCWKKVKKSMNVERVPNISIFWFMQNTTSWALFYLKSFNV